MTEDRTALDDLAAAVADGADVDWTALTARAETPQDQERIARFALLARIADVHAAASDDAGPVSGGGFARLPAYAPGDDWGPLRIVELLGAGTFGTVYRAHDATLARDVALKIFHLPASGERPGVDAVAEGRLLARVRHPHVVSVYGAEQYDGGIGLWMELVEGQTLEDELEAHGSLSVEDVMSIGVDLARALHAVHTAGLLHRDLKTQNVMRDARDGRVVLMDFSAGRDQLDATAHGVWPATMAGSPLYMAPEVLDGAPASASSDVYSLGVVLFRLLTTSYPVHATTLEDVARAHRSAAVTSIRQARPGIAAPLATLVNRAMDAEPLRRPTARDLADSLARMRGERPRRIRLAFAAVAITGMTCIGAVGYLALERQPSVPPPRPPGDVTSLAVTSTSNEAVRLYHSAAAEVLVANEWSTADATAPLSRADQFLMRALSLDSRFAAALSLRARVRELRDVVPDAAIPLAEQALEHAGSLPPAERLAIEGYAHRLRADVASDRRDQLVAAAGAYENVLSQAPGDYWALKELSRLYRRLQQWGDAERVTLQGVRLHPRSLRLAADAVAIHLRRRDRVALRRVATEALVHARPEDHHAPSEAASALSDLVVWEAKDAWMDGDPARALAAVRRTARAYAASTNYMIPFSLASAFESLGCFDEARATAGRITDERARKFKLALIDARQERWSSLATRLTPGASGPEQLRLYAYMYIWAGWLDDAERFVALQKAGAALEGARGRVARVWRARHEFEAQLRTAQGRPAEALALFAPLLVDEVNPQLRMREAVARARLQVGDAQGARTLLDRVHREPIMAMLVSMGAYDWLRCVVLLAEIDRDAGRHEDARRAADTVRGYLAVADRDNPFAARLAQLP